MYLPTVWLILMKITKIFLIKPSYLYCRVPLENLYDSSIYYCNIMGGLTYVGNLLVSLETGAHARPGSPVSPLKLMIGRILWNAVLVMLVLAIASRFIR